MCLLKLKNALIVLNAKKKMTEIKRKLDLCYAIIAQYLKSKGFKKKGLLFKKQDDTYLITFQITKTGNHIPGLFYLESGITYLNIIDHLSVSERSTPNMSHILFGFEQYDKKYQRGINVEQETDESAVKKTEELVSFVDEVIMKDMSLCMDITFMKANFSTNPFFYKVYISPRSEVSIEKWLECQ